MERVLPSLFRHFTKRMSSGVLGRAIGVRSHCRPSFVQFSETERSKLYGLVELDKIVTAAHGAIVSRQQVEESIQMTDGCPIEVEAILRTFDTADVDNSGQLTVQEWKAFLRNIENETLTTHNSICGGMAVKLDLFEVGAWNDWEFSTQGSILGGLFTTMVIALFILTLVTSTIAYFADANTTVQQKMSPNDYTTLEIPEFFIYVRTPNWENILDETFFSFRMSMYTKMVNASSGDIVESWTPVDGGEVSQRNITWWPSSVPPETRAYAPISRIAIAGAYHQEFFKQLEIKLTPCQNGTAVECKPTEMIHNALHGGSVSFVIASSFLGYTGVLTEYWTILLGETKQIDLWFARQAIKITGKSPFSRSSELHFINWAKSTYQVAPLWTWDGGTTTVWWFSQMPTKLDEEHTRETLSDLFGIWGGTWTTLLGFFGLFAYKYNKRLLARSVERMKLKHDIISSLRQARVSHERFKEMHKQGDAQAVLAARASQTNICSLLPLQPDHTVL